MNIRDFNSESFATLTKYLIIAFTFTVATIWIVIAFQFEDKSASIFKRLAWPIFLPMKVIRRLKKKRQDDYNSV